MLQVVETDKRMEKKRPPKTMGRPPGVPNKLTRIIKEAILLAGEAQGNKIAAANKEPREGLVSYLKHLAANHPQSYAMLLGKVLPMQIERLSTTTAEYKTVEELQQALCDHG